MDRVLWYLSVLLTRNCYACTLAGANYGYLLLWALIVRHLATIVLQEMSARLGLSHSEGYAKPAGIITKLVVGNGLVWL